MNMPARKPMTEEAIRRLMGGFMAQVRFDCRLMKEHGCYSRHVPRRKLPDEMNPADARSLIDLVEGPNLDRLSWLLFRREGNYIRRLLGVPPREEGRAVQRLPAGQ